MDLLLDSLRTHDPAGVETWMEGGDWQTIVQVLQAQSKQNITFEKNLSSIFDCLAPTSASSGNRPAYMDFEDQRDAISSLSQWNCPRCTFINAGSSRTCEICSCEKGS